MGDDAQQETLLSHVWHRLHPPLCSRAPDFRMDKRGNLFEALFAEFVIPPILKSGAQDSRLADPTVGTAFGLLGLLAAQKP